MKIKKVLKGAVGLMLAISIVTGCTPASLAYTNGSDIDNQWSNGTLEYGVGDPYIVKFDGVFYLYVSTLDGNTGIKVWSSKNMVDWKYGGYCNDATDTVITTAYAPEVYYWNGMFYMYTAPGGGDHRVLTSTSPLGPFKRVGERLHTDGGNGIDGSIYIDTDADATKYFYRASGECIRYGELSDDLLHASGNSGNAIPAATIIGHWTEGPSVFKRDGKYYMTYTGNHVQADNYMIEYAVGNTPVDLQEPAENRLLINTQEGITGLGHNSTVVGPDLDSRYIVYHSLVNNTNAPERRLNIDRMVFNGQKLEVQGPTWWEMDNPKLPDFADYMENANNWDVDGNANVADGAMTLSNGSRALSERSTNADYTAEFNLRMSGANAEAGALVSYTDDNNYAYAYITANDNLLHLDTVVNGVTSSKTAKLPSENTYTGAELHKLTVKKEGNTFDLYADDRLLITAEAALGAGKIGMKSVNCDAKFSFTAFSSTVNGNEDAASVKPTGSAMDAVHANSTSRTFEIGSIADGSAANLTSHYVKGMTAGDSLTFKINPQQTAHYTAEIKAKAQAGTTVSLKVDGKTVAEQVALSNFDTFATDVVRNLKIEEQAAEITLTVEQGTADVYSLKLSKQVDIFKTTETQSEIEFEWLEGRWSETATTISATNAATWSKAAYGSEYWGDYEISTDVNFKSGEDTGILFRIKYATDSSDEANGIGGCNSPDYHYGYYAYIAGDGVHLGKQMFDWKALQFAPKAISKNTYYNLKVRAEGANIKIWLNDELVIDYTDVDVPILSGRVGMRVMKASSSYKNYTLTHLNTATPLGEPITLNEGATPIGKNTFKIYSNSYGKGYEIKDGGIDFNNGQGRSIKGYLLDTPFINGTVSCDLQMPGTGGFGVGLLVRAKQSSFGNNVDDIDGVGVQLERGRNGGVNVNVYGWQNRAFSGILASATIENYFVNRQPRTAKLSVEVKEDTMRVSVDGNEVLTADISDYPGNLARRSIGFRSHITAHVTLTNFTYDAEPIPTDYTAIQAKIAEAEAVDTSGYTPATVQTFNEALAAAKTVSEDSTATQAAVDEATTALTNAIKKLVYKADPSAANESVQAAEKINLSGYTADSAKAVTDALAALKAVIANVNATQAQMRDAKEALDTAIANLKPVQKAPVTVAVSAVKIGGNKTIALTVGKSKTLTASVSPTNATNKAVTWTSSNTKVATVTNGKVKAKAVGTAKITVKAGTKTATVTIKVNPKKVKKLTASKKGRKVTIKITKANKKYKTLIQYKKKGAKNYKKLALTDKTKVSKTLKKGKYQIRACSYVKTGGKVYKSAYTSAKTVTIN